MKQTSGYEIVFKGMKKVPFGYEEKPIFANFPFHTLGYENFGCFFLMGVPPPDRVPTGGGKE